MNIAADGTTPNYLTYLPEAKPTAIVVEGEGRIDLAAGPISKYDTRNGKLLWQFGSGTFSAATIIQGATFNQQLQLLGNGDLLATGTTKFFFDTEMRSYPEIAPYNGAPKPFQLIPSRFRPTLSSPTTQEGIVVRYTPLGIPRFFSFFGGMGLGFGAPDQDLDSITDATVDPFGQVVITGRTNSTNFPASGITQAQRSTSRFIAKLDGTLSTLSYSTFLNRFNEVKLFPETAGGFTLIGSGQPNDFSTGPNSIIALRVLEKPLKLPRINSVVDIINPINSAFAGLIVNFTYQVFGEGFSPGSVAYLNDQVIASTYQSDKRIDITIPVIARGEYALRVETGGKSSQVVKVLVL